LENSTRYTQLSAIYDAGSFFYGVFEGKEMRSSKLIRFEQLPKFKSEVSKKIAVRNSFFSILPNKAYDQKVKLKVLKSIPGFLNLKNPIVMENEIDDHTITVWGMEKSNYTSIKELKDVKSLMHFSSAFIQACLFKKQDGIYFHVFGKNVDVALIINGKLELYNLISCHDKQDLLYYTMYFKTQSNLDNVNVYLSGECNKLQQDFVKGYVENVDVFTLDFSIPAIFKAKEFYTGIEAVQLCE